MYTSIKDWVTMHLDWVICGGVIAALVACLLYKPATSTTLEERLKSQTEKAELYEKMYNEQLEINKNVVTKTRTIIVEKDKTTTIDTTTEDLTKVIRETTDKENGSSKETTKVNTEKIATSNALSRYSVFVTSSALSPSITTVGLGGSVRLGNLPLHLQAEGGMFWLRAGLRWEF